MSIHFVTNERIAETSSKGNQEKWVDGNRWYKLDQFGYEALTETMISQLLERSNCEQDYRSALPATEWNALPPMVSNGQVQQRRFPAAGSVHYYTEPSVQKGERSVSSSPSVAAIQ